METKQRTRAQQAISALLFLAIIVSLGWLSTRFKIEADWTAGNRNSLTEPSRRLLASMPDPIKVYAFVYPNADVRRDIDSYIHRYQQVKSDVALEFIDPATQPQKVKDFNVSSNGEVVIEYQGRRENLRPSYNQIALTEHNLTSALQRLSSAAERWVVFLEGHGERSINEKERDGYSQFAQELKDKGIKVRTLNLATDPRVPDNTSLLVLAAPGRALLEGEQKLVLDYLDHGGSLLWLTDPENDPGAPKLAESLGVSWPKGVAIMLESAALGLSPFEYIYVPTGATHPVLKDFIANARLPGVRGLQVAGANGWSVEPLLVTTEQAWLETGDLNGEIPTLDESKGDTKGPLTIAATLTRDVKEDAKPADDKKPEDKHADKKGARQQRVAIVGDSDFLSNAYYGQLGNSILGVNIAQWLSSRDAQLNIEVPKAPDTSLFLPPWASILIGAGFVVLLPLGLLGFGITRWVMRRRR